MENIVSDLISIIAPCISAVASCITIYVTHKNAKESVEASYKQIEIERNDSIRQEQRYQEEKENLEMQRLENNHSLFWLTQNDQKLVIIVFLLI